MISNTPRWCIVITHIPTGITVTRTSQFFRNQHLARDSALRYLKSRLYLLEPKSEDVIEEYYEEGISDESKN